MSYSKAIGVLADLLSWAKAAVAKSQKEQYENDRKKSASAPADKFESSFGAGGLCDNSSLQSGQADNGKGE